MRFNIDYPEYWQVNKMKKLAIILLFLYTTGLNGQSLDSIAIDDDPYLNKFEEKLIKSILEDPNDTFDFDNKRIAFVTGSSGSIIVTKSDYFKNSILPWIEDDLKPQIFMVRLTDDEKIKSGGYDILLLSWVKLFTNKRKEKTIRQLGKNK